MQRLRIGSNGKAYDYKAKSNIIGWVCYENIGVAIINPRVFGKRKKRLVIKSNGKPGIK